MKTTPVRIVGTRSFPPHRPTRLRTAGGRRRAGILLLLACGSGAFTGAGIAQADSRGAAGDVPAEISTAPPARAPVVVDGDALFLVRGTSAYPAAERARAIADRIRAVAADPSIAPESLELVDPPGEPWTRIVAGDTVVATLYEADARAEQVTRRTLATTTLRRIQTAIVDYREARRPEVLARAAILALALTAAAVLLAWGLLRIVGRFEAEIERRVGERARGLEEQSHRLVRARHLVAGLHRMLRVLRVGLVGALAYAYLDVTLGLFPWTRGTARSLFALVASPLQAVALALLRTVPDLLVVAVVVVLARYVLTGAHRFFAGVESGTIRLRGFDREWALPTYRIVRVVVIAFAAVVAYPYVPGSDSEAFKGISIFTGWYCRSAPRR